MLMPFCEQIIAEVISLKRGLGLPRENFIPFNGFNNTSDFLSCQVILEIIIIVTLIHKSYYKF